MTEVVETERSNMEIKPFFSGDINMELKDERSVQESVQEDILDLGVQEDIMDLDLTELIAEAEVMFEADLDDICEAVPLAVPPASTSSTRPRPRGGH